MPREPAGYMLTWVCYGTWLHGDERGSVRRERRPYAEPVIESDPELLKVMQRKLKQPPYLICPLARARIEDTIMEVCRYRKWYLAASNVRANHVHVVVCGDAAPEKMLGDLKAWCTRKLREAGIVSGDRRVWADGGSTRYLWDAEGIASAVDYVVKGQGPELPRQQG